MGRGLSKADTTPEGPIHIVHVSLRKLCKGSGGRTLTSVAWCASKVSSSLARALQTSGLGGVELGCTETKSGASAPRKGWEQRCLGCQRPLETYSSNQGNFTLEPAQNDELLPNSCLLKGPGNSAALLGAGAAWVPFNVCPFVLNVPTMNIAIVVKQETHT